MLTNAIKNQIFTEIITTPSFLGKYGEYDNILSFLVKIWDLKNMPSEDGRFKNAYDDSHQHLVNNSDWTMEYLFLDRFKLIEGDEKYFVLFIEAIVSPAVRQNKDEILQYVLKVNTILQPTGFRLTLTNYFEDLPVYRYKDNAELDDLPVDIIPNSIPIFLNSSRLPLEYPCFTLRADEWDDYGNQTTFHLTFKKDHQSFKNIGKVKIMKRDEKITKNVIPEKFTSLGNDYCSLGQRKDYYVELKDLLNGSYSSFLLGMRDVANFPKFHEQFENDTIYRLSLIRGDELERLARKVRFEIEGINPNEYYKFNYTHKPPYAENTIPLNFDFEYETDFEHRIYALIGKNGTGKTRILSSLAKDLSEKEPQNFSPRKPIYGKVFTVSYSFFDTFEIPTSDASFNYVYCGLKKSKNTWKTEEELVIDFYKSALLIKRKKLEDKWYEILSNFIVPEILDIAFEKKEGFFDRIQYVFHENKFGEVRKLLSSGQSIMLFMISEILSQIRYDSLILFDEPETHLHPNAISALLNTLFSLVKTFQSFCVIATHSPLIIQEIPARNIFVIERDQSNASVRGLERESFGENLTVITQEIFGNREVPKHFISLIEELVNKGRSYDEIISTLESDSLPITSNVRLYVKALMPA